MKDLKLLESLNVDQKNNKVKFDFSKIYKNIDLPETLSNIKGKGIKKITSNSVIFDDGEEINLDKISFDLVKPLIWW